VWFVRKGRNRGSDALDALLAEVNRAELRAETCSRALAERDREHSALEARLRRLEAELAELRQARIEAYSRWWETREERDRALHVARRLRRRLARMSRRLAAQPSLTGGAGLPSGPVALGPKRGQET